LRYARSRWHGTITALEELATRPWLHWIVRLCRRQRGDFPLKSVVHGHSTFIADGVGLGHQSLHEVITPLICPECLLHSLFYLTKSLYRLQTGHMVFFRSPCQQTSFRLYIYYPAIRPTRGTRLPHFLFFFTSHSLELHGESNLLRNQNLALEFSFPPLHMSEPGGIQTVSEEPNKAAHWACF